MYTLSNVTSLTRISESGQIHSMKHITAGDGGFRKPEEQIHKQLCNQSKFSFVLNLTGCIMLFYLKDRLKIRMKSSKARRIKTKRLHCTLKVGSPKPHITIAPDFHVPEALDPEGVCSSEDT